MEKIKVEIDIDLNTGDYDLVYKSDSGEGIEIDYLHEIVTKVVDNWKIQTTN